MYSRVQHKINSDSEDERDSLPRESTGVAQQQHVDNGISFQRSRSSPGPVDTDDVFGLFSDQPAQQQQDRHAQEPQPPLTPCLCDHKGSSAQPSGPHNTQAKDSEAKQEGQEDAEGLDGAAADKRELLLCAIPLYHCPKDPLDGLVFLPVANFKDVEDYEGVAGKLKKRIEKIQDKVDDKIEEMKAAEPGTMKNKMYQVGHQIANDMTAAERLTRNIPKHVNKVIVMHPSQIPPDQIMEKISTVSSSHTTWNTAKAVVATLLLPVAWGVDILIIPGPSILTWYTSYQIYKNATTAVGAKRLSQFLAQGEGSNVRVNYSGDVRLDPFWDEVRHTHDGVLDEESLERLVDDIAQPDLLEPLLELRKRWLTEHRKVAQGGSEYQPIRTSESSAF